MAIPQLTKDIAYISKLGDYPNTQNNLSAEELRKRFDQAALDIQAYLNETLSPYINNIIDVEAFLTSIIDYSLTKENYVADAKAVGEAIAAKVSKVEGTAALPLDSWSNYTQTVAVEGVTGNNTVLVVPGPENFTAYIDANVRCSAQADGMLTFVCDELPEADVSANVLILN